MKQFLFYRLNSMEAVRQPAGTIAKYQTNFWRPMLAQLTPQGLPTVPFAAYWGFHYFRIFSNRDFCYFLAYDAQRLVHYCAAYPRFFRFPFMASQDIQIGSIWTDPEYRGQGLAQLGVAQLLEQVARPGRHVWYVVDQENQPSVRLAERLGFNCFGSGTKSKILGLPLLGAYHISNHQVCTQLPHERSAA